MKNKITINFNWICEVKLTEKGKKIWDEDTMHNISSKYTEDGILIEQLSEISRVFGIHLSAGYLPVFKNYNIDIYPD